MHFYLISIIFIDLNYAEQPPVSWMRQRKSWWRYRIRDWGRTHVTGTYAVIVWYYNCRCRRRRNHLHRNRRTVASTACDSGTRSRLNVFWVFDKDLQKSKRWKNKFSEFFFNIWNFRSIFLHYFIYSIWLVIALVRNATLVEPKVKKLIWVII